LHSGIAQCKPAPLPRACPENGYLCRLAKGREGDGGWVKNKSIIYAQTEIHIRGSQPPLVENTKQEKHGEKQ